MSFNLFYTGRSGLSVSQSALVTTAHNTANVNTEGYSRQSAQISSNTGTYVGGIGFFGNGAQATDVTRSYDQFLTRQLNQAQSSNESLSTQYAQITQIDNLLANQTASLSPLMQGLFNSVQAVANTPADPAARQQLLGSAEAMANQFRATSLYLSGLNTNVNEQIVGNVDQINTYATQIADLNKQISLVSNAGAGHAPNDLLDQRDLLVSDLSKLVGTKVVVQSNGQYSVFCWQRPDPGAGRQGGLPEVDPVFRGPESKRHRHDWHQRPHQWSCRTACWLAARWAGCCSFATKP